MIYALRALAGAQAYAVQDGSAARSTRRETPGAVYVAFEGRLSGRSWVISRITLHANTSDNNPDLTNRPSFCPGENRERERSNRSNSIGRGSLRKPQATGVSFRAGAPGLRDPAQDCCCGFQSVVAIRPASQPLRATPRPAIANPSHEVEYPREPRRQSSHSRREIELSGPICAPATPSPLSIAGLALQTDDLPHRSHVRIDLLKRNSGAIQTLDLVPLVSADCLLLEQLPFGIVAEIELTMRRAEQARDMEGVH